MTKYTLADRKLSIDGKAALQLSIIYDEDNRRSIEPPQADALIRKIVSLLNDDDQRHGGIYDPASISTALREAAEASGLAFKCNSVVNKGWYLVPAGDRDDHPTVYPTAMKAARAFCNDNPDDEELAPLRAYLEIQTGTETLSDPLFGMQKINRLRGIGYFVQPSDNGGFYGCTPTGDNLACLETDSNGTELDCWRLCWQHHKEHDA